MDWIYEIASESVLNQARAWLCERRRDYSPNDDVWDVRWRWDGIRPWLQAQLLAGVYRIGAVRRFPARDETVEAGRPSMRWCRKQRPSFSPPIGCQASCPTATTWKGGGSGDTTLGFRGRHTGFRGHHTQLRSLGRRSA